MNSAEVVLSCQAMDVSCNRCMEPAIHFYTYKDKGWPVARCKDHFDFKDRYAKSWLHLWTQITRDEYIVLDVLSS